MDKGTENIPVPLCRQEGVILGSHYTALLTCLNLQVKVSGGVGIKEESVVMYLSLTAARAQNGGDDSGIPRASRGSMDRIAWGKIPHSKKSISK